LPDTSLLTRAPAREAMAERKLVSLIDSHAFPFIVAEHWPRSASTLSVVSDPYR
jgi:hypothetical protein